MQNEAQDPKTGSRSAPQGSGAHAHCRANDSGSALPYLPSESSRSACSCAARISSRNATPEGEYHPDDRGVPGFRWERRSIGSTSPCEIALAPPCEPDFYSLRPPGGNLHAWCVCCPASRVLAPGELAAAWTAAPRECHQLRQEIVCPRPLARRVQYFVR